MNEPEDWFSFLSKAAKGSAKATDILPYADMAYMVSLTGDQKAPETLDIKKYEDLFISKFPDSPPSTSVDSLIELGSQNDWYPHRFTGKQQYLKEQAYYQDLWRKKRNVNWTLLINDAFMHCIDKWSAKDCLNCLEESSLDYNSLNVVSAMLYLSLTWPST